MSEKISLDSSDIGYTKRLVNQIHQPFFVSGHFPIPFI